MLEVEGMSGFDDYRAVNDERRRISGRSNEWACLNDCSELTANVFRDYDELIGCPSCNLMINTTTIQSVKGMKCLEGSFIFLIASLVIDAGGMILLHACSVLLLPAPACSFPSGSTIDPSSTTKTPVTAFAAEVNGNGNDRSSSRGWVVTFYCCLGVALPLRSWFNLWTRNQI